MLFTLGLLLPICFIPGLTGASVPTQWAVLSIVLPLGLWSKGPITLLHKLLFAFLVYVCLSYLWSVNAYSWVWGIWLACIWALSFHLGTITTSLAGLWKGLAIGLSLSSAVAVAQALEFVPVVTNDPYQYAGLLYNTSLQGIVIALVLIALLIHRLYWYMPPLAIGLILAGSRGSFLILALGLTARFTHWLFPASLFVLGALAFIYGVDLADSQRLQIWGKTLPAISLLGQGAGAYVDLFYITKIRSVPTLVHPEFVHNDILQLLYEFGLGAIALIGLFALAASRTQSAYFPLAFCFACLTTFYFPLYAPITAFIGCVVAGHIACDWAVDGYVLHHSRSNLLSWLAGWRSVFDLTGGEIVPVVPRAKNSKG